MRRRTPAPTGFVVALALALVWLFPQIGRRTFAADDTADPHAEPSLVRTFHSSGRVSGVDFDSKGERLVGVGWENLGKKEMDAWTAGTTRGDIRVWNVASGAEIAHFGADVGGLFDVAVSPDDKSIVTAGRAASSPRKGEVKIWDLQTHKPIRTLAGPTNWVLATAWSSDGKLIAAGGFDRTLRVWEAGTGKLLAAHKSQKTGIQSLRFSADREILLASYGNGTVILWNVASWTERDIFDAKGAFLLSADLSRDGKRVVASGAEAQTKPGRTQFGRIHAWDAASGREEEPIQLENNLVSGVAFAPNGKYYAAAAMTTFYLRAADSGKELWSFSRPGGTSGDHIRFSPTGKQVATSGFTDATLWDVSGLSAAAK